MNNSIEKLALSSTFAVLGGKMQALEETFANSSQSAILKSNVLVDSKYRVIELIGQGGMGSVYKVHHQLLQKDMALKTICTPGFSSESWQRFQREAQAIAKLRHKNIVEVFDFGIADGNLPYYTMELLEGESLAQRVARLGPCDAVTAMKIFIQVAAAMAHAHRLQIVHRDIKPANIFLVQQKSANGQVPLVKIVDFGTAKLATEAPDNGQFLTGIGTIFGSPLYMSPEQSMGTTVDQRSDIYSFGCSLFHVLTGAPPFVGDNAFLTMISHQGEVPPTLREVNSLCQSSQRLDNVMAKLLAKGADARFQTFEAVSEELKICLASLEKPGTGQDFSSSSAANDRVREGGGQPPAEGRNKSANTLQQLLMPAIGLILVCVAAAAAFYWVHRDSQPAPLPTEKASAGTSSIAINQSAGAPGAPAKGSEQKQGTGLSDTSTSDSGSFFPSTKDGELGKNEQSPKEDKSDLAPFLVSYNRGPAGKTMTITFPKGQNNAFLSVPGRENMPCSGTCTVPLSPDLCLVGVDRLTPAFIRRFRPDAVPWVHLRLGSWTLAHMEAISHLTDLRGLDINCTDLDGRAIPYINKLTSLTHLKVQDSAIRGEDLAKLVNLPKIKMLAISRIDNASALLKQLTPSCCLHELVACNARLTDQDLSLLTPITSVGFLLLDGNDITDKGLIALEKLPRLNCLSLARTKVGPGAIDSLSRMKYLNTLTIAYKAWPYADQRRLRQALPGGCALFDAPIKGNSK